MNLRPGPTGWSRHRLMEEFTRLLIKSELHPERLDAFTFLMPTSEFIGKAILYGPESEEGGDVDSIQLVTHIGGAQRLPLAHINNYNRRIRYAKLWLDEDGDAFLELNIPLRFLAPDTLQAFLRNYDRELITASTYAFFVHEGAIPEPDLQSFLEQINPEDFRQEDED